MTSSVHDRRSRRRLGFRWMDRPTGKVIQRGTGPQPGTPLPALAPTVPSAGESIAWTRPERPPAPIAPPLVPVTPREAAPPPVADDAVLLDGPPSPDATVQAARAEPVLVTSSSTPTAGGPAPVAPVPPVPVDAVDAFAPVPPVDAVDAFAPVPPVDAVDSVEPVEPAEPVEPVTPTVVPSGPPPGPGPSARAPGPTARPSGPPPGPGPRPGSDTVPVAPSEAPTHPGGPITRIGEMLVGRGQLTEEQLDHAVAEQIGGGGRLGDQLIELGAISEQQLVEALADQLGLPVADLRQVRPDAEAVECFPEDLARRFEAVPLRLHDGALELALSDAPDEALLRTLEAEAGRPIVPFLAQPTQIREAISRTYLVLSDVAAQVLAFEEAASSKPRHEEDSLKVDERAPVVQVVTLILVQALRDRASDIHIEPRVERVLVRFRVDGTLRQAMDVPAAMAQSLVSRIKVMADMNIVERRRSQDGQFTVEIDGRPVDVRVSTTATIFGEKAVLRLLDKTVSLRGLDQLGMAPDTTATFSKLLTSPFGMVVCAGPTGSGKTTTLYAGLSELADPSRNVITIEDPVEYVLPTINQMQVNPRAGLTFADGLRAILRQDPDVILVGEIRDIETARIAMRCALTGHFVLSSIHATDAPTALQRFRDMGIEPFLMTSSVLAVASQRLLRRICPHCREPYEPSEAERRYFEQIVGHPKETFFHGAGCNLCSSSGYSERTGIYEVLRVTDAIKDLLLTNAGHDELRALAISEGMRPLRDEAMRLVDADVTTIAEVARSGFVD